jgi:5'-3' exonuclease
MGIERFYKTLEKKPNSGITVAFKKKVSIKYFYIDFNSILYNIHNIIETELNSILLVVIYKDKLKLDLLELKTKAIKYAEVWNYDLDNSDIQTYKQHFTKEIIDKMAINKTKQYLDDLLDNYTDNNLKELYIAFDGIPIMGKLIEQKQRRYMGYIQSGLFNKIYEQYKHTLKPERILFETNKVSFSRDNLVTWSDFMKNMEMELVNKKWSNIKVIISGCAYPGEGEKKITEKITDKINSHKIDDTMIYSPDSDVVLLAMIMQSKAYLHNNKQDCKFYVLHNDQQAENNSLCNINILSEYICSNILNNIQKTSDKLIKNTILNDFILIATVFGNDFIPRIYSIDVRPDFNLLLDLYANMYKSDISFNGIVYYDQETSKFRMRYNNLYLYLKEVSRLEERLLQEKYLSNTYNFFRISDVIGRNPTNAHIYDFTIKYFNTYGKFIKELQDNKNHNKPNKPTIEKYLKLYPKFLDIICLIEKNIRKDCYKYYDNICQDILNHKPNPFKSLEKKNIKEQYHENEYMKNKTKGYLFKIENKLSDYDINLIKLDRKLDIYSPILNSELIDNRDRQIGYVGINNSLHLEYGNMQDNKEYYYKSYLHCKNEKDISKICKEYLFGWVFVFDLYFNKNDRKYNLKNVLTWFYKYHRAPFLGDIVNKLNKLIKKSDNDTLDKYYDDLILKNTASRKHFLNRYEQLLYICPLSKIITVSGYEELIANRQLIIDLDKYIEEIWKAKQLHNYELIDCRRISFLNKCILYNVPNLSFKQFIKLVKPYRHHLIKSSVNYDIKYKNFII